MIVDDLSNAAVSRRLGEILVFISGEMGMTLNIRPGTDNLGPEAQRTILVSLVEALNELDEADTFGTNGWRYVLGLKEA